jgi:hypothetical protein
MLSPEAQVPDVQTLIETPDLLCGESVAHGFKCDLNPCDPKEAADLVTYTRADLMTTTIFTEIADTSPDPVQVAIAKEAAVIAQRRYGIRVAVASSAYLAEETVPATVQLTPGFENAVYAFDEDATARCRQQEHNERLAAASLNTGEMTAIDIPQPEVTGPLVRDKKMLTAAFRGLLKYFMPKKAPVSYYERSLQSQAALRADVATLEAGNLPAHTTTELNLLKGALQDRIQAMDGVDKVEHQALLTRLENGEVPVTHSLICLVRQRGASALIRLLAGEPLAIESASSHLSFLTAIQ